MENYLNQENEKSAYYFHVSVARLVFLSILSCGIFEAYWMYKNWKYIKGKVGGKISPFWRAVFGVFYCRKLLREIHEDPNLTEVEAPRFSPTGLTTGWIICLFLARIIGDTDETGTAPHNYSVSSSFSSSLITPS